MAKLNWTNTAVITNLNGGINDSVTSLTVDDATGYPTSDFKIWIDDEVVLVGSRTGTTFSSLTRGHDGTTAAAHGDGAAVRHVATAEDFQTIFIGFPILEPGSGQDGYTLQYDHASTEFDWVDPLQGGAAGPYLPLAGGTMTGPINMGTDSITGITDLVGESAAALRIRGGTGQAMVFEDDTQADRITIYAQASGDIDFLKKDGTTTALRWDESADYWDFNTGLTMSDNNIWDVLTLSGSNSSPLSIDAPQALTLQSTTNTGGIISFWADDGTDTNRLRLQILGTTGDILFQDNSGVETVRWDESDSRWEYLTPVHITTSTNPAMHIQGTDRASINFNRTGAGVTGVVGNDWTGGNAMYLIGTEDVLIRSGQEDFIRLEIIDDTTTLRTRMQIEGGSGDIRFSDNAGVFVGGWDDSEDAWLFNQMNQPVTDTDSIPAIYASERRGTNLWYNGSGMVLDNTNFPGMTYDGAYAHVGKGGFTDDTDNGNFSASELIPVDPTKAYLTGGWVKHIVNVGQRQYLKISQFDADGLSIAPWEGNSVNYRVSSQTTLAAAYDPNVDTTITLTDGSGWDDTLSFRAILFYPYENSFGYQYPDYEYTQHANLDDFTEASDVLTLNTPGSGWPSHPTEPGGVWPIGTKIQQSRSSGSYIYPWNDIINDTDWHWKFGITQASEWWNGVAFIKPGFLTNYTVTGGEVAWSGLVFQQLEGEGTYLNLDGTDTMEGDLDMGGFDVVMGNGDVTGFNALTTVSQAQPHIILDSVSTGDVWTDQGAYIALGEGATVETGETALRLTYTGDGYGWIGMGDITGVGITGAGKPENSSIRFYYANETIAFNRGNTVAFILEDNGDIGFYDDAGSGTPILYWDESDDRWEFNKDLYMFSNADIYLGGNTIDMGAGWIDMKLGSIQNINDILIGASQNMAIKDSAASNVAAFFRDGTAADGDIVFYDDVGAPTLSWDQSLTKWLIQSRLDLSLADSRIYQNRTTQAGGQSAHYFRTADTSYGALGLMSTSTDDMYLVSYDNHIRIDARSTGASAQNIYMNADDATGAAQNRLLIDGDGVIQFFDNTGASQAQLEVSGALNLETNILYNIADPSSGNQVGDRDYNDARYLAFGGGTLTGDLTLDGNNLILGASTANWYVHETTDDFYISYNSLTRLWIDSASAGTYLNAVDGSNFLAFSESGTASYIIAGTGNSLQLRDDGGSPRIQVATEDLTFFDPDGTTPRLAWDDDFYGGSWRYYADIEGNEYANDINRFNLIEGQWFKGYSNLANNFGGTGFFHSHLDNVLWRADRRMTVSYTGDTFVLGSLATMFDGNWDSAVRMDNSDQVVITIDAEPVTGVNGWTYPQGSLIVSYYNNANADTITLRTKDKDDTWVAYGAPDSNIAIDDTLQTIDQWDISTANYITHFEITIDSPAAGQATWITQIEYFQSRPSSTLVRPFFDLYSDTTLYTHLTLDTGYDLDVGGFINVDEYITLGQYMQTVAVDKPYIVLNSTVNTGDAWDQQGAHVSIGENTGETADASMRMTYTGSGYGYVGMGQVGGAGDTAKGHPDLSSIHFNTVGDLALYQANATRLDFDGTTSDILFYAADGTTNTLLWDESDSRWEFNTDVVVASEGNTLILAGTTSNYIEFWRTGIGSTRTGLVGNTSANNNFFVVSEGGSLYLRASDPGAASQSIFLQTDDATGTLQLRQAIGGSGDISFYAIDGSTITAQWDESETAWVYNENIHMYGTDASFDSQVYFYHDGTNVSAGIGHKTAASDDFHFRSFRGDLVFEVEDREDDTGAQFQLTIDDSVGALRDRFIVSGITGNIVFYDNAAVETLRWDEADSRWEFSNDIDMTTGSIRGLVNLSQGDPASSSKIEFSGQDMLLRDSTLNAIYQWDDSDDWSTFYKKTAFTDDIVGQSNRTQTNISNGTWWYRQGIGMSSSDATKTGTFAIKVPSSETNMMNIRVHLYSYSGTSAAQLVLGGYTYVSGPTWVNRSAYALGDLQAAVDLTTVRFVELDSTPDEFYILLGDNTTVWNYPKIMIESLQGHAGTVDSDFDIEFYEAGVNDEPTWTFTSTEQVNSAVYNYGLTIGAGNIKMGGNDIQEIVQISSLDNDITINASNSGAAAQDITLGADDSAGTYRTRMVVVGDGNTVMYDNTGTSRLSIDTSGVIVTGRLGGVTDPSVGTHVGDRDYNDGRYATLAGTAGYDTTAIHDDTASEISAITAKATPTTSDFLLIEDAAAANVKKRITIGDLPTGATDHGALGGLGDDDHTQYLLVDGTRAMGGTLDMTGNTLDNVTQITAQNNFVLNDGAAKRFEIETGTTGDMVWYNTGGTVSIVRFDESETDITFNGWDLKNSGGEIKGFAEYSGYSGSLQIWDDASAFGNKRMAFDNAGDITLFDYDGTTVAMMWDESDNQFEFNKNVVFSSGFQTVTFDAVTIDIKTGGTNYAQFNPGGPTFLVNEIGAVNAASNSHFASADGYDLALRNGTATRIKLVDAVTNNGDIDFYAADGSTLTSQWDESDDRWEFTKPAYREGTATLTTAQMRNIYIGSSAPGSPQTGDVWLDSASPLSTYLPLAGGTMTGDITFDTVDTGLDYNNQGLSLNLGSKDVADDGVTPFIDFYSGSTVLAARILSTTDTGTSYSGGLQYRGKAGHSFEGDLLSYIDLLYDLGSTSGAWANLYVQAIRDENGNLVWDADGDMYMRGDQHFFNYGTETNSYLQHNTASNYFRFVQAGSEAARLTHDGTTTTLDLYGTGNSFIRKLEGTGLYIDNEVANQDIFIRTDNGGGVKSRMWFDGSGDDIRLYSHDGTQLWQFSGYDIRSFNEGSAASPTYSWTGDTNTGMWNDASLSRIYHAVNGVNAIVTTAGILGPGKTDKTQGLGNATFIWKDVWANDTTINSSDETLKNGMTEIPFTSARIIMDSLPGVWFKWKDGGERIHASWGAQTVAKAYELAGLDPGDYGVYIDPKVSHDPEMFPEETDLHLMIRPGELAPVHWQVTRSLVKENEELKGRVERLEGLVEALTGS